MAMRRSAGVARACATGMPSAAAMRAMLSYSGAYSCATWPAVSLANAGNMTLAKERNGPPIGMAKAPPPNSMPVSTYCAKGLSAGAVLSVYPPVSSDMVSVRVLCCSSGGGKDASSGAMPKSFNTCKPPLSSILLKASGACPIKSTVSVNPRDKAGNATPAASSN